MKGNNCAMKIIRATKEQIPEIIELWKEMMKFHSDMDPIFTMAEDGEAKFAVYLEDLIESKDSDVIVAVDNNRPIGYCLAQIKEHPPVMKNRLHGLISDLAVKMNYRRRGIGERLVNEALEWFKTNDINRVEVNYYPKNPVSSAFWKKQGFEDYIWKTFIEI